MCLHLRRGEVFQSSPAEEKDYSTIDYREIGTGFFAARIFRNMLVGFNVSFLAFTSIGAVSLAYSYIAVEKLPFQGVVLNFSLFAVGGILFGILFNVLFFLARIVASVLYRVQRYWTLSAPGVFLFIVLAEPLYHYGMLAREGAMDPTISFIYGGATLAILLPILYLFPIFRGYNATFLVLSAVGARILYLPCHYALPNLTTGGFILCHVAMLILTSALFLSLQIRHKLYLSPGFERVLVPLPVLAISILFPVLPVLFLFFIKIDPAYLLKNINFFIPADVSSMTPFLSGSTVVFLISLILGSMLFVLGMQWVLLALVIIYRSRKDEERISILPSVFLSSLARILSGFLMLESLHMKSGFITDFTNASPVLTTMLDFIGSINDEDGDGNSQWPGGDPDDTNICVRKDEANLCREAMQGTAIQLGHQSRARGYLFTYNGASAFQLVEKSLKGEPYTSDGIQAASLKVPGLKNVFFKKFNIVLPATSVGSSLRGIFSGKDGIDLLKNTDKRATFFSRLSEFGYRTVCVVMDDGVTGYMSVDSKYRLDTGCQVFERMNDFAQVSGVTKITPAQFIEKAFIAYARYREARMFLWVHYDAHWEVSGNEKASAHEKFFRAFLERYLPEGNVVFLAMNPPHRLDGVVYILSTDPIDTLSPPKRFDKRRFQEAVWQSLHIQSGGASSVKQDKTIGIVEDRSLAGWHPSIFWRLFHKRSKVPAFTTLRERDGHIEIFDGIRGIEKIISMNQDENETAVGVEKTNK